MKFSIIIFQITSIICALADPVTLWTSNSKSKYTQNDCKFQFNNFKNTKSWWNKATTNYQFIHDEGKCSITSDEYAPKTTYMIETTVPYVVFSYLWEAVKTIDYKSLLWKVGKETVDCTTKLGTCGDLK